jgi:hypothetical protein
MKFKFEVTTEVDLIALMRADRLVIFYFQTRASVYFCMHCSPGPGYINRLQRHCPENGMQIIIIFPFLHIESRRAWL